MLNELSQAVRDGDQGLAESLTKQAVADGIPVSEILEQGLIRAMQEIGEAFKNGDIFVPEMLIAARAMNRALEIIEPEMIKGNIEPKGTLIIGTVKGDLHDIGKNLVAIMFKGAGFRVVDLGTDVGVEKFIEAARIHKPDIIGMSSLLTTTMSNMQSVIEALKSDGVNAKIIVGGAPINREFAESINADGYAENAAEAADMGKLLLGIP